MDTVAPFSRVRVSEPAKQEEEEEEEELAPTYEFGLVRPYVLPSQI
jgi:hypothetical protein